MLFLFLKILFKIFFKYNDYTKDQPVVLNRDFTSTEMYFNNKDKFKYDSFIFGSSRTLAYSTKSWMQYLSVNSHPYHFDASRESVFGIYTKIKYLDKINANIKNCLVIICSDCTFSGEYDTYHHLFIKHPTIAGTSWIRFYSVFIRDFFDFNFLKSYFIYLFNKKYDISMNQYIIDKKITFDTITNEMCLVDTDLDIKNNIKSFYDNDDKFYKRDSVSQMAKSQITTNQIEMLIELKEIFNKHHTNYKIIISPLYSQISFNDKDINRLQNIFGKKCVYNFSGKNKITSSKYNYYDNSHYKPFVGDSILKIVYEK